MSITSNIKSLRLDSKLVKKLSIEDQKKLSNMYKLLDKSREIAKESTGNTVEESSNRLMPYFFKRAIEALICESYGSGTSLYENLDRVGEDPREEVNRLSHKDNRFYQELYFIESRVVDKKFLKYIN